MGCRGSGVGTSSAASIRGRWVALERAVAGETRVPVSMLGGVNEWVKVFVCERVRLGYPLKGEKAVSI